MIRAGLLLCLCAAPASAQEASLSDRLRALAEPEPVDISDIYAEERQSDLALIARHSEALFGQDGAAMAMFTGPDCNGCPKAAEELLALAEARGLTVRILDATQPDVAALMSSLTLDTLPSYVMADRMIRGEMPAFVLGRYLSE